MTLASKKESSLRPLYPILFHVGLGIAASVFQPMMKVFVPVALIYFIYRYLKKEDKEKQVLIAAAYFTGAEVFFRMTKGLFFYETGKYVVILFLLFGMLYHGFQKKALPFALYLLLLLPAVVVSMFTLNYDVEFRKEILFNLSGPICLAVAGIYCYGRTIRLKSLFQILDYMVYPLIATTVYVFLYSAGRLSTITGTASNSATSGGYGPNQVATVLGLGVFILFVRLIFPYKNKLVHAIMMFFLAAMAYRALLTFSRGGVYTAILMVIVFVVALYFSTNQKMKMQMTFKLFGVVAVTAGIWFFTVLQTGGMIGNRYQNEDALGREKADIATGRGELLGADLDAFMTKPVFGVGVGKSKYYHIEELGQDLPSHNEVSRMLSEHGAFGILALIVLLVTPFASSLFGRKNIFFLPFVVFWFATINHSSMRIAAPAFVYGLCLLTLTYGKKENTVSGE